MLKNSKGMNDAMLTFSVMGAGTTIGSIIVSILDGSKFVLPFGEIVLKTPDVTMVTAFLAATLLAYVTRRNKNDEYDHQEKMKKLDLEGKNDES